MPSVLSCIRLTDFSIWSYEAEAFTRNNETVAAGAGGKQSRETAEEQELFLVYQI